MGITLEGVRLWDGHSEAMSLEPMRIRIDRGEIASTGMRQNATFGDEVVSLDGCYAIPGLIDAHVHLDLDPWIPSPDAQAEVSDPDRRLRMIARAERMVRAGITTARDLGAGEWRELDLRDALARGELGGPRLLCAGQPLTVPAGHCHFWHGVADGPAEQAAVIDRQLARGVDWVKVMATGGVFTKGSGVTRAQFDTAEVRAAVDRAAAAGRHVAAHCHGTEGIRNAALGGVRTIEHCSFAGKGGFGVALDEQVVADIAASGTFVSPTVNAGWGRRIEKDGAPTEFYTRMKGVFAALRAAGVPMIASTDAGIPGVLHDRLPAGLGAFARYAELTPVQALRSATSLSARALGLEAVCGALRPGLSADVLVLDADPTEDLAALLNPRLAVARGRLYEPSTGDGGAPAPV
jgi:imidazolonepropionase-like amidohydrolase